MKPVELIFTFSFCLVATAACGDDPPSRPLTEVADVRFAARLEGPQDFARLSGEQWATKYLARVDGRTPPEPLDRECTFQNTATYRLHLDFLRTFPEFATLDFQAYLPLVVRRASRVLWAGELRLFAGARHPTSGRAGVIGLFLYADRDEPAEVDEIAQVYRRIAGCAAYAREALVLVGADTDQAERFREQAAALAGRGIAVVEHADLAPDVAAEVYSAGDAYGYLRIVQPETGLPPNLGPRDILVVPGATEEIGLVAGLVSAFPQNVHSHLNLRLREKGIPNARIANVFEDDALVNLDGHLARLRVEAETAALAPASLIDAEAFWRTRAPPIELPPPNLDERRFAPVAELSAADALAFGSKAANVGELAALLPERNRLGGFGVPFSRYREWMSAQHLDERVGALLAEPRSETDAVYRRGALDDLRDAIRAAEVPPALLSELAAAAEIAFGSGWASLPLRFRSSSNIEDGERLSGAGLHDSARGCFADDLDGDEAGPSACLSSDERAALEAELARRQAELGEFPERRWLGAIIDDLSADLTRERTVSRALTKVYASLWNDRAFEERAYFAIDQQAALMGVLVNPSFVLERADAVAVTNLADAAGGDAHTRLVSQIGGQPVVSPPDPTVVAETLTFRRGPDGSAEDVRVLTPSSLSPEPIWTALQIQELSHLLSLIQDHFAANVYPSLVPLQLDLEIKKTRDDRVVIKQTRPFVSAAP